MSKEQDAQVIASSEENIEGKLIIMNNEQNLQVITSSEENIKGKLSYRKPVFEVLFTHEETLGGADDLRESNSGAGFYHS